MTNKKKNVSKRTLTPEQIQKMQDGKRRVQQEKYEQNKTKERVEMLSDLDKQLAEGRKHINTSYSTVKSKHRRKSF